jgi:hypothetical protein
VDRLRPYVSRRASVALASLFFAVPLIDARADAQSVDLAPVQISGDPSASQAPAAPQVPPPLDPVAPLEIASNDPQITLEFNSASNLPLHLQPRANEPLARCVAPCRRLVARNQSAFVLSMQSRASTSFLLGEGVTRLIVEAASRERYDSFGTLRIAGAIGAGIGLNALVIGLAYAPVLLIPSSAAFDPIRTAVIISVAAGGSFLLIGGVIALYAHVSMGSLETRVFDQDRRRLARSSVRWTGAGFTF